MLFLVKSKTPIQEHVEMYSVADSIYIEYRGIHNRITHVSHLDILSSKVRCSSKTAFMITATVSEPKPPNL